MERRLAAILAADVVGYSRLIQLDETAVLGVVKTQRETVFSPKVQERGGRIVKLMGDGLLIEFPSAVQAVQCAVEIQHHLREDNRNTPQDQRVVYRMGINIGDVVVEDGDIYGDGVNLAARLEGLADPDGICVANSVRDQVEGKLDLTFEDMGARSVKNMAAPVHSFRVVLDDRAAALVSPIRRGPRSRSQVPRVVAAVLASGAIVAGTALWWQPWRGGIDSSELSTASLPAPGKPSIAVMAFDNLSGDAAQTYLSDGLSENIITALSRFPDFFVISRNSSFSYKGEAVQAQRVATDLGVRYVVEGSVQVAGDRLRVTAQLIDATTGATVWADQFDRDLQDVFVVQDEITRTIAATLKENIDLAEYDRAWRQPTESLGAYEFRKRAEEQWFKFTREGNIQALDLSQRAIDADPGYSGAHVENAWALINAHRFGWSEGLPRDRALELAFERARAAIELDPFNFKAYWVLAKAHVQAGNLERAGELFDRAIRQNPNSAAVLADSIDALVYTGQAAMAVDRMEAAMQLNPNYPDWYLWNLGWAQYFAEEYDASVASFERMTQLPNAVRRTLAPALLHVGREEDARAMIQTFLENREGYNIAEAQKQPFTDDAYRARWIKDLRQLGVPE